MSFVANTLTARDLNYSFNVGHAAMAEQINTSVFNWGGEQTSIK